MNAISAPSLLADPQLRPYLDDVRQWHGYVRFLGLPTLIDNPDTPMSDLFVMPALHDQAVAAESDAKAWPEGRSVLAALERNKLLVILGDPGSGKSTIVNWLAWMLAGGTQLSLAPVLTDVLPLPLVARELKLDGVQGFDSLIDAFLQRPVAAQLSRSTVFERLDQGGAMLLLDGLDEVSPHQRQALADALNKGVGRYPACLFVATSRVVGYDANLLDASRARHTSRARLVHALAAADGSFQATVDERLADFHEAMAVGPRWTTLHVMPFDDARIAAFAAQWYALRSFTDLARRDAQQFVQAVHANPAIEALARLPQLLTLMALVHRIGARLPDGRAILYGQIAEAYLRSIDSARGLAVTSDEAPWHEKQRWLARIGFEMQLLRQGADSNTATATDTDAAAARERRDLLAPRSQVLGWVQAAMAQSGYPAEAPQADDYLEWVARRSGLLLPRGEGYFSFVHLSFQEYFAALYIAEHLADADWIMAQTSDQPRAEGDPRVSLAALQVWSGSLLWQEVFVFISESFAARPRDAARLAKWLFAAGGAARPPPLAPPHDPKANGIRPALAAQAELLCRLVLNPHSGWMQELRDMGWQLLLTYVQKFEVIFHSVDQDPTRLVTARILSQPAAAIRFWQWVALQDPQELNLTKAGSISLHDIPSSSRLDLLSLEEISDQYFPPLSEKFMKLCGIRIRKAPNLISLAGIEGLPLQLLFVDNAPISSLAPLIRFASLRYLSVRYTSIENLDPLRELTALQHLYISNTKITNLEPLRRCQQLKFLFAVKTPINDLAALAYCKELNELYIDEGVDVPDALRKKKAAGQLKLVQY